MKTTVDVDKDSLNFLKAIYFGDFSDGYESASNRAYRDMNRTIIFKGLDKESKLKLRKEVTKILRESIKTLVDSEIDEQSIFDAWHREVCSKIKELYKEVELTYGQAQKWVNMTIKYLYILEVHSFDNVFGFLHVPIDKHILEISKNVLEIEKPQTAWSKWDNYEEYLAYQKQIRDRINECEPLRWEFSHWLKEARNVEIE